MEKRDFDSLILTPKEEKALRRYSRRRFIPQNAPCFDMFLSKGLISFQGGAPDETGGFVNARFAVNDNGRRFLYFLKMERRKASRESRRYWITTGIALLALLVAIASFLQSTNRIDISVWPPRLSPPEATRSVHETGAFSEPESLPTRSCPRTD